MNRRSLLKSFFVLPFIGLAGKLLAKDRTEKTVFGDTDGWKVRDSLPSCECHDYSKRPDLRTSPYQVSKFYLSESDIKILDDAVNSPEIKKQLAYQGLKLNVEELRRSFDHIRQISKEFS